MVVAEGEARTKHDGEDVALRVYVAGRTESRAGAGELQRIHLEAAKIGNQAEVPVQIVGQRRAPAMHAVYPVSNAVRHGPPIRVAHKKFNLWSVIVPSSHPALVP